MTSYQPTDSIATPLGKDNQVRVFSCLLESRLVGNRLYSYIRDMDAESEFGGCGYVYLDRNETCAILNISRSAWYSWLGDRECFTEIKRIKRGQHKGKTLIRYRSLKQICYRNGLLPDHIVYMSSKELGCRMVALSIGTEAMVAKGQRQAEYRLNRPRQHEDSKQRGTAGHQRYNVITAHQAVMALSRTERAQRTNPSSKQTYKGLGGSTRFRYFVISGRQRVAGVSQGWLANKVNRSESTIRRRLSASKRKQYGLDPIQRRRVAYEIGDRELAARVEYYLSTVAHSDYGAMVIDGQPTTVAMLDIGSGRRPYIMYSNVYKTNSLLISCKRFRHRLNRFIKFSGEQKSRNAQIYKKDLISHKLDKISGDDNKGTTTGFNTVHLLDDPYVA